jgi:hypothetical protein
MKKIFLSLLSLMAILSYAQKSNFKIGTHLGLPINGTENSSKFSTGLDATYLYDLSEKFSLGATTGFTTFFGKKFNDQFTYPNVTVIPITLSSEYSLFNNFKLGADVGLVIGASNIDNGYFYYHPKLIYGFDKIEFQAGFRSFIDYQTLNFGVFYKF